jgi:undecaprenyl-diphosphatase
MMEKQQTFWEKLSQLLHKYWRYLLALLALIGFIALAEDVLEQEIMQGDIEGYRLISKLISNKMTPFMKVITHGANFFVLLVVVIIVGLVTDNKHVFKLVVLNLVLITALNMGLKNIFQRERPAEFRLVNATGYSFPSGHSMVSTAFYGFIIYLIWKLEKDPTRRWIGIIGLSLLILGIGISRIYLGVHYTSDVVAGFLISIAYLVVYIRIVGPNLTGEGKG